MKNKYIIIDTETTGFHPYDGDELLQVSIIDTDGNVLFDEYSSRSTVPNGKKLNR